MTALAAVPAEGPRILAVQSGAPWRFDRLLAMLTQRHPGQNVVALMRAGLEEEVAARPGVGFVITRGVSLRLIGELRAARFDQVYVLFTREPGFAKLRILPFALGATAVYGVDESFQPFAVSGWQTGRSAAGGLLRPYAALRSAGSLAHRVVASALSSSGARLPRPSLEGLARSAAHPWTVAFLLGYERVAQMRARLRGGGRWKRER